MINWINGILGLIVIVGSLFAAPAGQWRWIFLIVGVVVAILSFSQIRSRSKVETEGIQ